jgi:hypothetical protein
MIGPWYAAKWTTNKDFPREADENTFNIVRSNDQKGCGFEHLCHVYGKHVADWLVDVLNAYQGAPLDFDDTNVKPEPRGTPVAIKAIIPYNTADGERFVLICEDKGRIRIFADARQTKE